MQRSTCPHKQCSSVVHTAEGCMLKVSPGEIGYPADTLHVPDAGLPTQLWTDLMC